MKLLNLPPVWLIGFLAAVWGLARLWAPLEDMLVWPGRGLAAAGIALIVWSGLAFRRARTTIVPHQPPSALVEAGPYRFSRNPIYLADLMILAGVALILGAPLALILLAPFREVLLRLFILPEEAVLERDLGSAYLDYKARVPRGL
ncbi:MAG: methyltransferase family protein [Alphaproteobacteria bacterium]